jgi:hypothetical protein
MTPIEFTGVFTQHTASAGPSKETSSKHSKQQKRKPQNISWFDGPYDSVRGESALWVAVITQAMMDALSRSGNPEAMYHKHEATEWLTGNGKDFVEVCLLAGFDPDYVRRKAKRALVAPRPWRAEPGKGKRYLERKAYRDRQKKSMDIPESLSPSGNVIEGPWQARVYA